MSPSASSAPLSTSRQLSMRRSKVVASASSQYLGITRLIFDVLAVPVSPFLRSTSLACFESKHASILTQSEPTRPRVYICSSNKDDGIRKSVELAHNSVSFEPPKTSSKCQSLLRLISICVAVTEVMENPYPNVINTSAPFLEESSQRNTISE